MAAAAAAFSPPIIFADAGLSPHIFDFRFSAMRFASQPDAATRR